MHICLELKKDSKAITFTPGCRRKYLIKKFHEENLRLKVPTSLYWWENIIHIGGSYDISLYRQMMSKVTHKLLISNPKNLTKKRAVSAH